MTKKRKTFKALLDEGNVDKVKEIIDDLIDTAKRKK